MTVVLLDAGQQWSGLSTDSKPSSSVSPGALFFETDTQRVFMHNGTSWFHHLAGAGSGFTSSVTITRPANTTPYTANDVVGGALEFASIGPAGALLTVLDLVLQLRITANPGAAMTTFRLHLYNVTPPGALADNAAFDVPAGDQASHLGMIKGLTVEDLGSTVHAEASGIAKSVRLASTSLFAYLVTDAAYTPAANSEVYVLTAHGVVL